MSLHRRRILARCAAALAVAATCAPALGYDWPQYNFDSQKSGNNTLERTIHRNNVGQLVLKWQAPLPGNPDGSVVVLENVVTAAGTTAVAYVNTREGHLLAYDTRNGTLLWSRQYAAGACRINNGASLCHMTSTPAIDPNRTFIYSYGLDGNVHKYQVGDGTEIFTGGWPQVATLKDYDEKHGGGLAIATAGGTSYLYVVHGGYPGDGGDYQGHVTTINLATGAQNVFNVACSDLTAHIPHNDPTCTVHQNAVWARPGIAYDASLNRVFFATGNGNYNAVRNWSESILAISPDGTGSAGKPLDAYTPTNFAALDGADLDLGSTAPVLLPRVRGANVPHLAMQGGKDQKLRLVNLANLSGQGGPGHVGGEIGAVIDIPQGGVLLQQPAVWTNHLDGSVWTFVANGNGMSALKVVVDGSGNPSLATQWQNAIAMASPIVANNLVFATGGNVRAFDAVSGTQLWSTPRAGSAHFHSPVVANGELYVTDSANRLSAFALAGTGANVDAHSGTGTSSNVNAVLEPGESVEVEPGWKNLTSSTVTLTGAATAFAGPAGATYSIGDATASYGVIAAAGSANCFTATGNCYRVTVSNPPSRPALNWIATLSEMLSTNDPVSLRLHVGGSFPDVPVAHLFYRFIETLVYNSVTVGFSDGTFQPDTTSPRAASAIFTARGATAPNGDGGIPISGVVTAPPITGPYDCVAGGTSLFPDLPPTAVGCKQFHLLANAGVSIGFQCATPGGVCPNADTTRSAMAVMIAGSMAGGDVFVPLIGTFSDTGVARSYDCAASPGNSHFPDVSPALTECRHVNYLWARGVIDGFVDGTFGPALTVTRGQMTKFIANGFKLPLY
jgi:S-layer family protein/putative pyrroloquinoline-quinone binding quinoprotein